MNLINTDCKTDGVYEEDFMFPLDCRILANEKIIYMIYETIVIIILVRVFRKVNLNNTVSCLLLHCFYTIYTKSMCKCTIKGYLSCLTHCLRTF